LFANSKTCEPKQPTRKSLTEVGAAVVAAAAVAGNQRPRQLEIRNAAANDLVSFPNSGNFSSNRTGIASFFAATSLSL